MRNKSGKLIWRRRQNNIRDPKFKNYYLYCMRNDAEILASNDFLLCKKTNLRCIAHLRSTMSTHSALDKQYGITTEDKELKDAYCYDAANNLHLFS